MHNSVMMAALKYASFSTHSLCTCSNMSLQLCSELWLLKFQKTESPVFVVLQLDIYGVHGVIIQLLVVRQLKVG